MEDFCMCRVRFHVEFVDFRTISGRTCAVIRSYLRGNRLYLHGNRLYLRGIFQHPAVAGEQRNRVVGKSGGISRPSNPLIERTVAGERVWAVYEPDSCGFLG
jgi:hypothetical protein